MNELAPMLDLVIRELEEKIPTESEPSKLILLLKLYRCAREELAATGTITTKLIGGARSYLDSYSDYMDNPLLDDMYAVEKVLKAKKRANSAF